jgi:hypothetical protein
MANNDRPRGFHPYGPLLRARPYSVDADESDGIFKGDVIEMQSDGNVGPAAAGEVQLLGAALTYNAASTASTAANPVMVADNPHQLYEAQDDGAATPAQTNLGNSADHVAGTGSTVTKLSGHEIGLGSLSTSDGGFKLLDFVQREDNEEDAVNADWVCQLNQGEGLLTLAAGV